MFFDLIFIPTSLSALKTVHTYFMYCSLRISPIVLWKFIGHVLIQRAWLQTHIVQMAREMCFSVYLLHDRNLPKPWVQLELYVICILATLFKTCIAFCVVRMLDSTHSVFYQQYLRHLKRCRRSYHSHVKHSIDFKLWIYSHSFWYGNDVSCFCMSVATFSFRLLLSVIYFILFSISVLVFIHVKHCRQV